MNRSGGDQSDSNILEMYGDYNEELSMTTFDSSEIIGFNHRFKESKGSGEVSSENDFK